MRSLMVVVPNKLLDGPATCGEGKQRPDVETFVVDCAKEALDFPVRLRRVGAEHVMPDVEVRTYLHQSWPSLVEDIDRQPPGTRTVVVGYSLGANSSVFVANKVKYVDLIIALQPSMFSWNPSVTGNVGRMVEIYNPNRWMTFGGMGSNKLVGPNIEYIANNDSHPGAEFNPIFRNLVKTEVANLSTENELPTENRLEAEAQCDSCKALY